jgi:branched-chain amino acid transport system substrate-binding protein
MKLRRLALGIGAVSLATTGTAVVAASSAGAASGNAPINIAWEGFETGAYATPNRHNDIELAIKQINAKGGVDGHLLTYKAYDTGFSTETALTGTQQAIASHPTAIIGYSVDDFIRASASVLRQAGTPVLSFGAGPASLSSVNHLPNLYTTAIDGTISGVAAEMQYAVKTYHPKSVGIFVTDDTASKADAQVAQQTLKKLGVKNISTQTAADTATDSTNQALSLKGDDLVFQDGFPTVLATFDTELRQNGYTGPIADGMSGDTLAAYGLVKQDVLNNYFYFPYCAADVIKTPQAEAYVAAYKAAYPGVSIRTATPYAYDSVMLLAAAIKKDGGNLSSSAISKALGSITYQGVCGTYKSDVNHEMIHTIQIISVKNGPSSPTLLATIKTPVLTSAQIKQFTGSGS